MVNHWGWTKIHVNHVNGPSDPTVEPHRGFFDSAQLAREHLLDHLGQFDEASTQAGAASLLRKKSGGAGQVLVTCPPHHAWAIYPIRDGISADQAALFFINNNKQQIWDRLDIQENKITLVNSGCAVAAMAILGAAGTLAAAWARGRWGV